MTDVDKLVRIFYKIDAARKAAAAEFNALDTSLKAQQKVVEDEMLRFLNETGQKTAKTEHGLFYWQEKLIAQGADWDAFYSFVREENAFDALERRIKTSFIKDYMEANDGGLPPGVNLFREREIRVRKN